MVKLILIDLDDTLLDFKRSERCAIEMALEFAKIAPTDAVCTLYSEINDSLWKKLETGDITRKELLTKRFEILFEKLGVTFDKFEMQKKYMASLSEQVHFIDGAIELLENLSKKYSLAIISNGTIAVQNPRLDKSGIRKYFSHIFISEELGVNKPAREFFEKVLKTCNESRENCVVIGDSESSDILGGINAGIRTIKFSRSGDKGKADAVATALCEIPDILEKF